MDIVDQATRSRMMSGIRGRDTSPELCVRRLLHSLGFRYRLHDRSLPGTPDIVLPKFRTIVQVQGCFWHGHDCHLFKLPETRREFWIEKINSNRQRDRLANEALIEGGWRVAVVWECALKRKTRNDFSEMLSTWIRCGDSTTLTISGSQNQP
ncbi:MAG: DNA mismatch endonuclease Vsr [Dechloromonas sp.]|nr:DNA mismatch endonuclease Vsr [Dechloromonas sp.]